MLETMDTLTAEQVTEVTQWFDQNIGTDYEISPSPSGIEGDFYIFFFDLEGNEWDKLEGYLRSLDIAWE